MITGNISLPELLLSTDDANLHGEFAHTAKSYYSMASDRESQVELETGRDDKNEPCVFCEFIADLPDVTDEFPDAKYDLKRHIFARVEKDDIDGWVATFEEADIAMSGIDPEDALQSLRYEIVYSMESLLSSEDVLSPKLKRRLDVLCCHIKARK